MASSEISTIRYGKTLREVFQSIFPDGVEQRQELFDRLAGEGAGKLRFFTTEYIGSADIPKNVYDALPAFTDVIILGLEILMRNSVDTSQSFGDILMQHGLGVVVDVGLEYKNKHSEIVVQRNKHFLDEYLTRERDLKRYERSMRVLQTFLENEVPDQHKISGIILRDMDHSIPLDPVLSRLIFEKLFVNKNKKVFSKWKAGSADMLLQIFPMMLRKASGVDTDIPWDTETVAKHLFPWSVKLVAADRRHLYDLLAAVRKKILFAVSSRAICTDVLWMFSDKNDGTSTVQDNAATFWSAIAPTIGIDYDVIGGGKYWPANYLENGFGGLFFLWVALGKGLRYFPYLVKKHSAEINPEAIVELAFKDIIKEFFDQDLNEALLENFILLESPAHAEYRLDLRRKMDWLLLTWSGRMQENPFDLPRMFSQETVNWR